MSPSGDGLPPENIRPTRARHISFSLSPLFVARVIVNLFSGVGERDPPSESKTRHVRLITIGPSHFGEKVRWGLDMLEADPSSPIYYTEDAHPPPFVSFASVPASADRASQTPMIVMKDENSDENKVLYSSEVVLRELCPFLYPKEIEQEIEEFEEDMGKRLGAPARCIAYHHLLQPENHAACTKICGANTSTAERVLFDKMLDKGVDKAIRKLVVVNEETARVSEDEVRRVFTEVSDRLEKNGGKFMMDSPRKSFGFTAADLTFAALAYPLVRPPELKRILPVEDTEFPPVVLDLSNELRATRAGQYALTMYAKHRLSGGATEVVVKSMGRNVSKVRTLGVYSIGTLGMVAAAIALARRK